MIIYFWLFARIQLLNHTPDIELFFSQAATAMPCKACDTFMLHFWHLCMPGIGSRTLPGVLGEAGTSAG